MLNSLIIQGRLTRDPEFRKTQTGVSCTSFTLACERDYGGEKGERETDFIDVVTFRNVADFVAKSFTKGDMAVASGRIQVRKYTDKSGETRRATELRADNVYYTDGKRKSAQTRSEDYEPAANSYSPPQAYEESFDGEFDDTGFPY